MRPFSASCSALSGMQAQELASQTKKRLGKQQTTIPRLATANHLKKLDRSLEHAGQQYGLEFCRNWQELEKWKMLEGVSTGIFGSQEDIEAFSHVQTPSVLATTCDQEQTQVTGNAFCEDPGGLRLTKVSMFDFFHRWWNCLNAAMALAGLTPVFYAAVMIYNIGYGPWESCAWWNAMLATGQEVASTMNVDGPLIMAFWKQILVSKSQDTARADHIVGRGGREAFLESLKQKGPLDVRNKKVKPSIWMSFHQAHDAWDKHIGTRGMILAALSLKKGWIKSSKDLFADCGVKVGAVSGGTSGNVKNAKAKIDALKKKAGSSVAAVTKLVADDEIVAAIRLLALGSRAIYTYFSKVQRELKGPAACAAFSLEWASWKWLQPLKETLQKREDVEQLRRSGFIVSFPRAVTKGVTSKSAVVVQQDSLAHTLGVFTMNIVCEISGHMTWWTSQYPGKFALMASTDIGIVKQAMDDFYDDCNAYWKAKDTNSDWQNLVVRNRFGFVRAVF